MSSAPTALHPRPRAEPRTAVFRPDIEGLRAVAVLLVVAGHAGIPWLKGGFVGVDVFFVISGFLITGLLVRELRGTGRISVTGFYARRATRLLPAATVVVAATLAASWLWLPGTRMAGIARDALASGVYAINFRLAATGTQYLNADAPPSPLQHFWSLAVEEQFYLLWPLLLIATAWGVRRRFRPRLIIATLAVLAAGSLWWSAAQTAVSAPWAYFGIHTRAWELAAGGLLALAAPAFAKLGRPFPALAGWLGLALVVAAAVRFDELTPFPGVAALLPVTGTVLVIAAGCAAPAEGAGRVLGLAPFRLVGRVSYGYYLWHWPILLIAPAALGLTPSVPLNLALMVAAFGVAIASYHLVEQPVRTRRVLTTRPWRGIGLGAGLTATAAAVAVVTLLVPPSLNGGAQAADPRPMVATASDPAATLAGLLADAGGPVPGNLTPGLTASADDKPAVYDDGCHLESETVAAPGPCVYGDPAGKRTIVLFGDSHAAQWFPALDTIARERGARLVSWTKSSCAVSVVGLYNELLKRPYRECGEWRERTLSAITELRPDMVVTASADADSAEPLDAPDPDRAWTDGWVEAYDRLATSGAQVVHIADTPWPGGDIPDCLAADLDDTTACAADASSALKQPARRAATIAALTEAGATVIDPTPWFCAADGVCPPVVGNLLVYRDAHHMTTVWAELLAGVLGRGLPELG
ncbi:acyltransferase family protein [Phytomonospora endophytica]|uniref:Peptidoglycan/LPS O-acetylase OafA/YrhL n=1 Tax=Phytomonospora endophytica TaxID=714109 RepID=A0A841FJY1_9ACTN|nr:acyltransferase family protein [Phytomonospora endophytica]MBB6033457.1 peptidoglycan/LPS O-acetylase OafA/YrhL [Phytomonospora endophytica]GIG65024.1 acyltransferase [Phytomonospora endophytica]